MALNVEVELTRLNICNRFVQNLKLWVAIST